MDNQTLTPTITEPQATNFPQELADSGITMKNLEFLDYLGMKDEMLNPETMNKVEEIGKYIKNTNDLMKIDLQLGESRIGKLDSIYSYVKLLELEADLKIKQDLINQRKCQMQQQSQN